MDTVAATRARIYLESDSETYGGNAGKRQKESAREKKVASSLVAGQKKRFPADDPQAGVPRGERDFK